MDRTNTPSDLWFLATQYAVYLLNHLAVESLKWRTPIEVATGETPDISNLLQFHWYQKVYYLDPTSPYPSPKEKVGRFVGIAENVGDTLTYEILTDDTRQVIYRSVVRAADKTDVNLRAVEFNDHNLEGEQHIFNEEDVRDGVKYPEISIDQIIGFKFIKQIGEHHYSAEVLEQLEDDEDSYRVKIGDSGCEELMHYSDLVEEWDKHHNDPQEDIWIFKEIIDHRQKHNRNKVKVLWDDESETWEPLSVISKADPITCAEYAFKTGILHLSGWRRFRRYSPKGRIMIRALRRCMKLNQKSGIKYQFGVHVARSYKEALALDKTNGNTLWQDAIQKELDQIIAYKTFIARPDLKSPPEGYQFV